MSAMLDLGPVARRVTLLVEGVGDEQLGAPTPCEAYAVRDILEHFVGLTAAFRDAATKSLGETTGTAPPSSMPDLSPDWRTRLPRQLDEMAGAWRKPEAWEGVTQAGGVTLPGEIAGRVALNELVLHGWDLARATGQDFAPDAESLRASIELLGQSAGDDGDRGGIFGPPVEVPGDASLLDRAVALSGRRPDWTPPV